MAREKIYKKCPRCGEKMLKVINVCENCKLVFSRLQYASNKKAKRAIIRGEREKVIKTKDLPSDVSKWKLFLICLFTGYLGVHNIYIGRYFKGFFSLIMYVLTAILILLVNSETLAVIYSSILFIPGGLVIYFWFYDLLLIGLGKYKVPIALNMPITENVVQAENAIAKEDTKNEQ